MTVAVVDSGLVNADKAGDWDYRDSATGTLVAEKAGRCFVYRDFLPRSAAERQQRGRRQQQHRPERPRHPRHLHDQPTTGRPGWPQLPPAPVGVAPQVNLLVARALDKTGAGTYAERDRGHRLDRQQQDGYNVRVLNLSLYAPVAADPTGPTR